jgi:hypothetical protein
VPGCHGGGATPEAAIADAISALREFAAHQHAKGISLAAPRAVQDVMRDEEAEYKPDAGEAIVMVPLILDQARPVKANISLDAGLLEAIDEEAQRRGLTRSSYLASAAVEKIGKPDASQGEMIARLRAELAASHERLARQAAHFMGEMRRLGVKTGSGQQGRLVKRDSVTGSLVVGRRASKPTRKGAKKGEHRKERSR